MFQGLGNKKDKRNKEGFFSKNGAAVLEQIISLHNGDCNLIQSYDAQQLHNATSNFRWMIYEGWNYKVYKGIHEEREISVKKFDAHKYTTVERIANEIAIASRMSNHRNVLKLLGCCLETELPLLVYESHANGNLASYVYRPKDDQLPWESKLKIVTEIANAVAYLHHGLSKMIIHRDIKPTNIFLDGNNGAKLFEFQDAIPIPEGETHVVTELCRTVGFIAPELLMLGHSLETSDATDLHAKRGRYTEESDVYGFGVSFCDVLIGKRDHELVSWHSEISSRRSSNSRVQSDNFWEEILAEYCEIYPQEENRAQVIECAKLVFRCVKENPEERPNIIEVERALRLIKTI